MLEGEHRAEAAAYVYGHALRGEFMLLRESLELIGDPEAHTNMMARALWCFFGAMHLYKNLYVHGLLLIAICMEIEGLLEGGKEGRQKRF